jgi:iron only hydrogenase large subunit-like protein
MGREGRDDIDAVLTTRELAKLFKMKGIDINKLDPDSADTPFGERSSAGKLFAATGGVMEAAVRTAHYLLTGRELPAGELKPVRGMDGIKEARLDIGGKEIGVAVAHGLENARRLLEEIKQGKRDLHFVEIMTCPGGCIGGGGQPIGADTEAIKARMQALYKIDKESQLRTSHGNEAIKRLYDEFLGEPSGEKSHELLHTKYVKRDVLL